MKFKLLILLLIISRICLGQNFSNQVKEFITIDDSHFAISNVTVIDGTGGAIKKNQTVIVLDGKILRVGDEDKIPTTPGIKTIDGKGKTVIPGLVMLHEHMFYSKPFENWFSVGQMSFTFPRLYLAGGVTSMRTGGSIQPQSDLNVKQWVDEGLMTGPKMHVTGPFIEREGYKIPELGFIGNTEEVSKIVNYWADKGVTSFKVYNHITKEDLRICVEEAHKRGLKVTGHLCSLTYEEASNIGIDNLEHGFRASSDFVVDKDDELCDPFAASTSQANEPLEGVKINRLIDLLIKNGTAITTTPVVFEPYTDHEIVPGDGLDALLPQIQDRLKSQHERMQGRDSSSIAMFNKDMAWVKRFYDKGGVLVAGTDPTGAGRTVAGYANQRTVEILVEAGFPLVDAIKICTLDGAKFLGISEATGTIVEGKQADFILINGDLETEIRTIRNMEIVFKDGIGFDSQKMFNSVKGKVGFN